MIANEKLTFRKQMFFESFLWGIVFILSTMSGFDFLRNDVRRLSAIIAWILIVLLILGVFKAKEKIDESAKSILGKVDGACLKFVIFYILVLSLVVKIIHYRSIDISFNLLSMILTSSAFIILFLRALLFCYHDRKGI